MRLDRLWVLLGSTKVDSLLDGIDFSCTISRAKFEADEDDVTTGGPKRSDETGEGGREVGSGCAIWKTRRKRLDAIWRCGSVWRKELKDRIR